MRVRETFPDAILDQADEVVLVDLSPQELQERIRAGKVYKPDRVDAALGNFFRLDNLGALRELALREVAEDVGSRRLVIILGGHFIEERSDRLVETVKRVAEERGTTYVFLGTPDERRRTEILRGSLVSALVRELRGIDIRVVANRADRPERPWSSSS